MIRRNNDDSSYGELMKLWILRLFSTSEGMARLFDRTGFRDVDIGRALELEDEIGYDPFDKKKAESMVRKMHADYEKRAASFGVPAFIHDNFLLMAKVYMLDPNDTEMLMAIAIMEHESVFNDCFKVYGNKSRKDYLHGLARMLNINVKVVSERLGGKSMLRSQSIIKWTASRHGPSLELSCRGICEKLLNEECDIRALIQEIVNPSPAPTLAYSDYPHIQETLQMLRPHLRGALAEKRSGVNIYIHGAPGTGKSELVRVLAREFRAVLYEVSFTDSDGDPVTAYKRLESLRAAQAFLKKQRSLLVFDEAEDVFTGEFFFKRSVAAQQKAWMNRMFETNPVPTFWVSNSLYGLDDAFIRRFDFVFELGTPPRSQRKRSFKRICKGAISNELLERIAECENLTPAVVAKAQSVALSVSKKGSVSTDKAFTQIVKQTLKAQGHKTDSIDKKSDRIPSVYSLSYLNSDTPLEPLATTLKATPDARLCLYGPPGTGKTTFGHWLSRELSMPLHIKKGSDLISPFVGMTERNLARAFEQAREDKAILLIDEVDSFLQDRRGAVRSWEVTEVNEMLTQMESFEGIFIATTNLMDNLDQAALRRFDLKVKVGYMNGEQCRELFIKQCKALGLKAPGNDALRLAESLSNATPGDFSNVARQHRLRGFSNADAYLQAVVAECEIKEGKGLRKMGFS